METNTDKIEQVRTELEKIMIHLDDPQDDIGNRNYLAGYIDCLADKGHVSDVEREILYSEYAF